MISIITSVYRAEAHLPGYITAAQAVARAIPQLELVVVANDATAGERTLLEMLAARVAQARVIHVPRETLYASWNRGVAEAAGAVLGFWNVDDVRTAQALMAGAARMRAGCRLVYFPYTVHRPDAVIPPHRTREYPARPYDREDHRRVMRCGPFFMFARDLYAAVGPFDERFRIVGDWDWCIRALDHTDPCPVDVNAGTFVLHGGNLSSVSSPLQVAEENIVHLRSGSTAALTPADPDLMRDLWQKFAPHHFPPALEARFFDDGAQARWQTWQQEQARRLRQMQRSEILRYLPKTVIDRLGLRAALARLGVVKARG